MAFGASFCEKPSSVFRSIEKFNEMAAAHKTERKDVDSSDILRFDFSKMSS